MKEFTSHSEEETILIAKEWAATLPNPCTIFLEGDLGAGKSIFARALIRSLTGDPDLTVPSPTFTLLQQYETSDFPIWHYDLYRLKDTSELDELSWDDALSEGIVLIEWPERLYDRKPRGITIHIDTVAGDAATRKIRIQE